MITILIILLFCIIFFLFGSWINTFGLERINYESDEEINKIGIFLNKKINAFCIFFVLFGSLFLLVYSFLNKNNLKKDYLTSVKNSTVKFQNLDQSFFKTNKIDSIDLKTSNNQRIDYIRFSKKFQVIYKNDTTNYKIVESEEKKGSPFYLYHLTKDNKTETLLGKFIPKEQLHK
ncbi:hypothetical protein [Algoriella sp.]|uniref:hypothetical protein n=1 Tax=Algoriella sp. TaxID=1872434 RepID=UPI002FCA09C6